MTQRKKEKNIFEEFDKRYGRTHSVVSLEWPDGDRFRRRCANLHDARNLLKRINGAIVTGKWEALRSELKKRKNRKPQANIAVDEIVRFGRVISEFKRDIRAQSLSDWPVIQGYIVDQMSDYFGVDTPINNITEEICEAYAAYRVNEGDVRNCTVNKELSVMRKVFDRAVAMKYLSVNPAPAPKKNLPDDSVIHDRYLQPSEFDLLMEAAMDFRSRADSTGLHFRDMPEFIVLGVNVGLRLCETLSEPIPHINFEQRIISVKNKPRKPTKNGRERHIRINQDTYDVLLDLRRRASNPAGTLFQLPDGSSWVRHRRIVQREFGQCVKAAGLHCADRTQNVTIHTLRHTFASWLALKGVPLRRVQYLMGHNSIETTERYAHLCAQETYEDTEVLQGVAKKWR